MQKCLCSANINVFLPHLTVQQQKELRGDLGPLPAIYFIFKQMAGRPLAAINGDKWPLNSAVIPRFSGCNPGIILGNKQMAGKRVGLVNQISLS